MATALGIDQRDQLWVAAFNVYYDSMYQELLLEKLIALWQKIDFVIRLLIAVTASGSAVSGWALWTMPTFRPAWVAVSSVAALGSIVHATLGVAERLKEHADAKRRFLTLRMALETFRFRMSMNSQFPIDEFTSEFIKYRETYAENVQLLGTDILKRTKLRHKVQDEVNLRLGPEIAQ